MSNYNVMLLYLDAKTNAVDSKDTRQHGMVSSWHLTSHTMFTIRLNDVLSCIAERVRDIVGQQLEIRNLNLIK